MNRSRPRATVPRRDVLRLILRSPLMGMAGVAAGTVAGAGLLLPGALRARPERALPRTLDEALDVFQIEAVARQTLEPAVWHFIVNGADDMQTVAANRNAFDAWQIRVRRLVDVSRVDTGIELFGQRLPAPIVLAPVGAQQTIHGDGELATMRAASARGHLMIASTITSHPVGAIRGAGTAPLWFQLYASPDQGLVRHLLGLAETAGCPAVTLTVDSPTRGNREGERWFTRASGGRPPSQSVGRMGNFESWKGPPRIGDPAMDWRIVEWLRANTRMKVLLKGIVTAEDAKLAVKHGADGLIISNHGGRQEESGRGTLECLPEIIDAVDGRLPVLIDGGFRRGTDIFKALALGAQAVCIGRPYLYGLGAWGEQGVARVLAILDSELKRIMQFAGTTSVAAITSAFVQRRP